MKQEHSLNLFIAAAGMGTRLQPVTRTFPKPLLPVAGITLVDRLLNSVQASVDIQNFGMNLHYQPAAFEQWEKSLKPDQPQPRFFYEKELLGTGGAMVNARDLFEQGTCLLINGDILTDIDWHAFAAHHRRSGNMVTLAVQDRAHERRVGVDGDGRLLCIDPEMKTPGVHDWLGYACAALYEPEFLDYLPGGESHIPPFWVSAAEKTKKIGTYDIGSRLWMDLGNISSYSRGILTCLKGASRFFSEPLNIPWDTQISGTCVIEKNVHIGSNVTLHDAILLPGTRVDDGEEIKSTLAGPDFRASFSMPVTEPLPRSAQTVLSGSDRIYSHTDKGLQLEYSAFESMIERQICLTTELRKNHLPVPEIYSHNASKRQMMLQDLGDESLRHWCRTRSTEENSAMLKTVLDTLIDFQWADLGDAPCPRDKPFDQTVLRWESAYFLERCVYRIFNMNPFCTARKTALTLEFKQLADAVSRLPRNLMHRDFQSENVMIANGAPWFIDFQAAHHGPCFYDAASLIGDPYLSLPRPLRKKLEAYYLTKVTARLSMSREDAQNALVHCGIQRHMQALGAYGFLSAIRGKTEFIEFISPALNLLHEEVSCRKMQFPVLNELVDQMMSSTYE